MSRSKRLVGNTVGEEVITVNELVTNFHSKILIAINRKTFTKYLVSWTEDGRFHLIRIDSPLNSTENIWCGDVDNTDILEGFLNNLLTADYDISVFNSLEDFIKQYAD